MREKLVDLIKQIVIPFWARQIADHLISNDAVPVVRCKDCKHTKTDGIDAIYCEKWDRWEMPEDFFCSYGERKDGEG